MGLSDSCLALILMNAIDPLSQHRRNHLRNPFTSSSGENAKTFVDYAQRKVFKRSSAIHLHLFAHFCLVLEIEFINLGSFRHMRRDSQSARREIAALILILDGQ